MKQYLMIGGAAFVRPRPRAMPRLPSTALGVASGMSRRDRFWRDVETELRKLGTGDDLARIYKFVLSARGFIDPPEPQGELHMPCEEFVEGLTASPWWDTSAFPWVAELEAAAPRIAEELARVEGGASSFACDSAQRSVMGDGWAAVRLQRMGEWKTENTERFPETTAILQGLDIPFAVRGVMFARQVPGTGVAPHSDARNFILTAHLGLKVPKEADKAWIKVGTEQRNWAENEAVVFDTSFQHSTFNESEEDRMVLIIDFWHPELSEVERTALQMVYDIRNEYDAKIMEQASQAKAEEGQGEAAGGVFGAFKNIFGGGK